MRRRFLVTVDRNVETPLADRIARVRERLAEIEEERAELQSDDFSRKAELLDEEHTLEARLAELRSEASESGVGIAEREAAGASSYERVPEIPDEGDNQEVVSF
jgi:predicted  nucleic acid-binding Zn-ribbon protein